MQTTKEEGKMMRPKTVSLSLGNDMKNGYRLHIESTETEPNAFRSMAEVRAEQRILAKKFDRTFAQIDAMSYIVTEEEYQAELAEKKEND